MDGKHYTYDQEGDNGVWSCEYQQTDQTVSVCDRTKDRLDKQGKILSVATAKKDDLELIAVIMAAPDPKARFKDATTLLNYGFGKCTKYKDTTPFELEPLKIRGGIEKEVPVAVETEFQYIDTTGANLSGMKRKIEIDQEKQAPVKKGEKVGTVTYLLNGKKIGEISIQIQKSVGKMQFKHAFAEIFQNFLL